MSFRRDGGEASVVSDEAFAREAFMALSSAEAVWVGNHEYFDPVVAEESCFIFTMPDGGKHEFTLYSVQTQDGSFRDYVAVQPPVEAIGTQYYSLEQTDAIWALQFEGYENIKAERGVTDDLLPLYGAEYEAQFAFGGMGEFVSVTATRRIAGEVADEVTFLESDYAMASDMAQEMSQMDCTAPLDAAPESDETCTFVFTGGDGREYTFEFTGNCAAIPYGGGVTYYPVEHGMIDEGGVWDIVMSEQELLSWKRDVDFGGEKNGGQGPQYWALAAAAAVAVGAVVCVVRLAKNSGRKNDR